MQQEKFQRAFKEFLSCDVAPNLELTFVQVMETYMCDEEKRKFYVNAYETVPAERGKLMHAAFKIMNTRSSDHEHPEHLSRLLSGYSWTNDAEKTVDNVVDYVSRNFPQAMIFPHNTDYYDFHVYFKDDEVRIAEGIAQEIRKLGIRCYDLCDRPVGPHPLRMFEVHAMNPGQYYILMNLLLPRGLPVLIHPNRPFTFEQQHYHLARWLNGKLTLRSSW